MASALTTTSTRVGYFPLCYNRRSSENRNWVWHTSCKDRLQKSLSTMPCPPEDWYLLDIHWKGQFYFDKSLLFGLHSSPFLFDVLPSAHEYIFKQYLHNLHIIHYLDDFLIPSPPHSTTCLTNFTAIEKLFDSLGVFTKEEKRTYPATVITFLGIDINTVAHTLTLFPDKLTALLQELQAFSRLPRCTKLLLSLIGKPAFAVKVIPAGRIVLSVEPDCCNKASSNAQDCLRKSNHCIRSHVVFCLNLA